MFWLVSCVNSPPQEDPAQIKVVAGDPEIESQPLQDLPGIPLTESLLVDLLTAEIASQRGQTEIASDAFTRTAFETRDPRLVTRATLWNLFSKRYHDGLDLARLWLELAPGDLAANKAMAQSLIALGRTQELTRHLEKMISSDSHRSEQGEIFLHIAELMARQEDAEQFIPVMQTLVDDHPDIAEAYFAQALLFSRLQMPQEVETALEETLRRRPDWEEAAMTRIGNLVLLERFEEVDDFARRFLQKYPQADKFRAQYARILLDQTRQEDAFRQYRQMIRNDPENADAYYAAGLLQIEQENWKSAIRYLEQYLKLKPDHDQSRIYIGQAYLELGQYDEALRWFKQVSSNGLIFQSKLQIAEVIEKQSGVDPAIGYLNSLVSRNEDERAKIILTQERIYREAGRLQDAESLLNQGLSESPENSDLLYARALLAAQLNHLQQHEADMRLLISIEPDNAHAYNALGYTLADQTDRYQEALALVTKALELQPDDPFILDSMGWVQYRLGQYNQAVDYLKRAFAIRKDAEIAAHLGELLWVNNDRKSAREIWQEGLHLNPDNQVLLDTIDRLDP